MTLLDFARMTRANLLWLLLFVLLGTGVAAAYTLTLPVKYSAKSTGYVVVAGADPFSAQAAAEQKAESYVPFVGSEGVNARIQAELGSVPGSVSAHVVPNTRSLVITAVGSDPQQSADLANAAMKATAEEIVKLETLGLEPGATSMVTLYPLYDAKPAAAPFSPNWLVNLGIGAGAGLVLGYAFAFVRRSLDGKIRYAADVESLTGRSALGVIPKVDALRKQRANGSSDTGIAAEALRQLRTNLRFVDVDRRPKSIVVTSCNPGEGKSTVSANLARLLAEAGQRTILIDADLRRPQLHRAFQIDNVVGLTQVLAGDATVADAVQMTDTRDLLLMPSGRIPPNPSELVGSHRMQRLIEALAVDYTVIIDAPPLLPVTDAGLLTKASDGALLVVAVGKTFKEQLRLATKLLGQINGHLLGSVLNLAPKRGLGAVVYGYGNGNYGQSYSSYDSEPEKEALPQVPAVRPIPAKPVARPMPATQPGHRPSVTPPEDTAPVSDSPAWPPRRAIAG